MTLLNRFILAMLNAAHTNLFKSLIPNINMEKIKTSLNIAIFIFLAGFISLEVWTLISHLIKT
jgi:hypothetical protein